MNLATKKHLQLILHLTQKDETSCTSQHQEKKKIDIPNWLELTQDRRAMDAQKIQTLS